MIAINVIGTREGKQPNVSLCSFQVNHADLADSVIKFAEGIKAPKGFDGIRVTKSGEIKEEEGQQPSAKKGKPASDKPAAGSSTGSADSSPGGGAAGGGDSSDG